MKICFFVSDISFVGGIERVVSILSNQLVLLTNNLWEIEIVSLYHTNPINYKINDNISIKYISSKPYEGKPLSFKRLLMAFGNMQSIRKFFKVNQYDYILSQGFPNNFLARICCGKKSGKIIGVEHVCYSYYPKFIRTLRTFVYKKLYKIVVLTEKDCAKFKQNLNNVVVIPNPFDTDDKFLSNLNEKRIIAIGRLEYQKGFDNFIQLYKDVFVSYPEWKVYIYGSGTMEKQLRKQIEALNLGNVIFLSGVTDNIYEEIRKSSFMVFPSRYEGFGMVLLECMSQGVPCISYDCDSGPSEIIDNYYNGILVPNQDAEAFKNAIKELIVDSELRHAMGKNAYVSVERFASKRIAQRWIDLLEER